MANPGEMHDGMPLGGNARGWWMLYFDPVLVAAEVEEEIVGRTEIMRPVAHDPLLAAHFARLFACITTSHSGRLANEENLLRCLMYVLRKHGAGRGRPSGPSPGQNVKPGG